MKSRALQLALLLAALAACSPSEKAVDTNVAVAPQDNSSRARTAASVANAIRTNPAGADSILAAAGYTRDSYQQLMYEIAADSAMSVEYSAAITR